ncbi:MAG: hypothetical protein FH756_06025 [Firmicutes bacterium]|nr:hypothetical protein [Bacillota bacterium]
MLKDLPKKIIPISKLRIARDKVKKCTCINRNYEVDTVNKEVLCTQCGAVVDPYDVLVDIAYSHERLNGEVENLLRQRKEILSWKPHLVALRKLESIYRGKMLPCCPHCGRGVLAEELLVEAIHKEVELERRKFEERK